MNTYIYFVYRVLLINKHRVSRDRKFNTRNFTTELFLLDIQNRNSMCVLPSQCVTFPPIREKKPILEDLGKQEYCNYEMDFSLVSSPN